MPIKDLEYPQISTECNNKILKHCEIGLWRMVVNRQTQLYEMYVDDVMYKLLGIEEDLTPSQVYNFWFERIDPRELNSMKSTIDKMMATGLHHEVEFLWEHPKLGLVHVRYGATARLSKDEKYAFFEGHHNIMKEVHQIRTQLRGSFEHVKTMFDATPIGAALCDGKYKLIECNPAQLKLFEVETFGELAKSFFEYCPAFQP